MSENPTRLRAAGLFGRVLALDHADGSRTFEEHEPDALRQRKNDIRDGKAPGVVRFATLEPSRGKSPDWRDREFAAAEAKAKAEAEAKAAAKAAKDAEKAAKAKAEAEAKAAAKAAKDAGKATPTED